MNDTDKARQLFFEALNLFDSADYRNAEARLREALRLAPGNASILTNLSTVAMRQGKLDEARDFSERALAGNPANVEALMVLASCHARQEKFTDALVACDRIIALEPRIAEAHSNRAHALNGLRRFADALASCDRAISLQPDLPDAHVNRGNALVRLNRFDDALDACAAALRIEPGLAEAHLGRGNALFGLKRYDEALAAYGLAAGAKPNLAAAWLGSASALADLHRFGEAEAAIDRALAIDPGLGRAWLLRGNMIRRSGRIADAMAAYDTAIGLDRTLAEAWLARGTALAEMRRYGDALSAYEQAATLEADLESLAASRLLAKMWMCDWKGFDEECARLLGRLRDGASGLPPLTVLAISPSAADQLKASARYAAEQTVTGSAYASRARGASDSRIRIAYLSPDFRDHAVLLLTAGMLEQHDRSRFEVFGVSLSAAPPDAMRSRIMRAVTEFIEVGARSDVEIVELLRTLEIDIAIDLAGHTLGARPNVLARRAAPIQVAYLGFPATTGAPYTDYIVADRMVVPPEARTNYWERVVYLPDCFQANDSTRAMSPHTPARAEVGLPAAAFVFCVFHSSYKLNPTMFEVWMNLLRQVPGSVLWVVGGNPSLVQNLRREAEARAVDPDRLVFAPRAPYPDHLARQRLADLFLDTFPFNGGTTTSDALWAGLPVLTLSGEAFAARMSASLLQAVGLPELAVQSLAQYEALALGLAREPATLGEIKARLARNRATHPLFDTVRFPRHTERAYDAMWQRHRRGEPPGAFAVAPLG